MRMKLEHMKQLIDDLSFEADWFEGWEYQLRWDEHRPYLQIRFLAPCNMNKGHTYEQTSRKWFLSFHMTDDEVVSTALAATKMCIEHEMRELFKWRGEPIYRPHYDIHALHKLSADNAVCKREEV